MKRMKNRRLRPIWIVLGVITVLVIGTAWYISDYYHAESTAFSAVETPVAGITVLKESDRIVFAPQTYDTGLIFYPGGKVEFSSYAPMMEKLAQEGILCVIVHMPGNLAVLDVNAADRILKQFPSISKWYIGGHSLGGAMASAYASAHSEDLEGLVLLGAYSTKDLRGTGLKVLSVYGSEDGVLNRRKYEESRTNLPENTIELVIDGGCHAFFGNYGSQNGDGIPTISREEQQSITVNAILDWIG